MKRIYFFWLLLLHMTLVFSQYPQACYDFDFDAKDQSVNGLDGYVWGSVLVSGHGNNSQAYVFDGVSDFIDITHGDFFENTNWTYSAWVNASSLPTSGEAMIILSIGSSGGDQVLAITNDYYGRTGFTTWTYGDPTSIKGVYTGVIPNKNQWYFISATRESDSLSLFVDGVLVSKEATGFNEVGYGTATRGAFIGQRVDYALSNINFKGMLDDVKIFNSALTAAQIKDLYLKVGCDCAELNVLPQACFPLQNNFKDVSGNNLNGTSAIKLFNSGHSGNEVSAHFDGNTQLVDITHSDFFKNTSWTYSAWMNLSSLPASGKVMIALSIGSAGGDQVLGIANSYLGAQGFTTWTYGNSSSIAIVDAKKLPVINQWYFVTAVKKVDSLYLFVDGNLISKKETGFSDASYGMGTPKAYIGQRSIGAVNNINFNGDMQDVRIFNEAFSESSVKLLYNSCPCVDKGGNAIIDLGFSKNEIQLLPNPNSGNFIIKNYGDKVISRVLINDVLGRVVYDQSNSMRKNNLDINLSSFDKGIFIVTPFNSENEALPSHKILVE